MRQGALEATQVADRFHLLKNVAAALQEVFSAHHREIDQLNHLAHHEPSTQDDDSGMGPTEPPVAMTKAQQQIAHNRAKRVTEYAQAHALHQQGWTMKAIATQMGRHHRTIKKYLEASTFPERPPRRQPPSILEYVDGTPALEIDNDGAVAIAFAPCPVIHPNDFRFWLLG